MCGGSEVGSYLRRIDSCITQLTAEGPAKTCTESEEERERVPHLRGHPPLVCNQTVVFNCLDAYHTSPESGERR